MKANIRIESQAGTVDVAFETDKEFSYDDFKDLLTYVHTHFGGGKSDGSPVGETAPPSTGNQPLDPKTREALSKLSFEEYMQQLGADDLQKTIAAAVLYVHFTRPSSPGFTEQDIINVMQASPAATKFYNGGSIVKELGDMRFLSPMPNNPGTYTLPVEVEPLVISTGRP